MLKAHAGVALPLAFLGMHQAPGPDEEKGESHDATLFAEVWQENVPGEEHNIDHQVDLCCLKKSGLTITFSIHACMYS